MGMAGAGGLGREDLGQHQASHGQRRCELSFHVIFFLPFTTMGLPGVGPRFPLFSGEAVTLEPGRLGRLLLKACWGGAAGVRLGPPAGAVCDAHVLAAWVSVCSEGGRRRGRRALWARVRPEGVPGGRGAVRSPPAWSGRRLARPPAR